MRIIRYQAYDPANCKMLDWGTCTLHRILPSQSGWHWREFIGLLDKQGEEIYEGDILCIPDSLTDSEYPPVNPPEDFNHVAEVVFQDGSFGVNIAEDGDWLDKGFWSFDRISRDLGILEEIRCVGNVYENPELLK